MSKKKNPTEIPLKDLLSLFDRDIYQSDIRLISIIGGYYLDYLVTKHIEKRVKNTNPFINNLEFSQKLDYLDSVGHWDKTDDYEPNHDDRIYRFELLNDLKILNAIRNHYAHNIINDEKLINNYVKQKADQLKFAELMKGEKLGTDQYLNLIQLSFIHSFTYLIQGTNNFDYATYLEYYNNVKNNNDENS